MKRWIFLIPLLLFNMSCTSIKDIEDNSGSITVGNNNIVINVPKEGVSYTKEEVKSNITYLQKVITTLNERIERVSTDAKSDRVLSTPSKPTGKEREITQNKTTQNLKEINSDKKKRENAFEVLKMWENLSFKNEKGGAFIDDKTILLNKYRKTNDSLSTEISKVKLENIEILNAVVKKGADSGKFDSLLQNYLYESIDDYPHEKNFVEVLDAKSYERMLTLWEDDIEKMKQGKKAKKIIYNNDSDKKLYIARRYFSLDNQWVTEGWTTIEPGEQGYNQYIYTDKGHMYIHANGQGVGYYGNGKSFTVSVNEAFTLVEKYDTDLYKVERKVFMKKYFNSKNEIIVTFG